MKRCTVFSLVLLSCVTFQAAHGQQLPSHGASAVGKTPKLVIPESPASTYASWYDDLAFEILYMPSPSDDRFDDMLGFNVTATFPLSASVGIRPVVGYESYLGVNGLADADVIPLGFSFMFSPVQRADYVKAGFELGLRYNLVDYSEVGLDFDDSFSGVVGVHVATDSSGGFGVELGVGYRFDIVESENDIGDALSLDGLAVKLALRATF